MNKNKEKRIYFTPSLEMIEVESEQVMSGSLEGTDNVGLEDGVVGEDTESMGRSAEYRRGWDNGR